jgi:hypothetical protein
MARHIFSWIAIVGVLLAGAWAGRGAEPDPELVAAEKIVTAARMDTDGPSLLNYLRKRTRPAPDRATLADLIEQLGDDDFQVRQKASRALVEAGGAAVLLLRAAQYDDDYEISRRAKECLAKLEQGTDELLLAAVIRVMAARKPDGAIKALLAYLPLTADDGVEEALLSALATVGLPGGKVDPALAAALKSRDPAQRAAAAFLLGKVPAQQRAVRALLTDSDAKVRFQAAQVLFQAGDKAAVAPLIALVDKGPAVLAWRAEDLLFRLVGDKQPPAVLTAENGPARAKCARLWRTWWKTNEGKVNLAAIKPEPPYLGHTLIGVTRGAGKDQGGRVYVFGKDGKLLWDINAGINGLSDVSLLSGGRFLLAEYHARRVTERNARGQILWEKKLDNHAISAQRLANGNTFIATLNQLLEVTRDGKTVFSYHKSISIWCAVKARSGHIVYAASNDTIVELDRSGKEVRTLNVGGMLTWGGVDVLPNGNYLVARYSNNQVVEVNKLGKVVWKCTVQTPSLATRLRNGHILVCSSDGRKIVEIDRKGKEVWKHVVQGRPFRARRY